MNTYLVIYKNKTTQKPHCYFFESLSFSLVELDWLKKIQMTGEQMQLVQITLLG